MGLFIIAISIFLMSIQHFVYQLNDVFSTNRSHQKILLESLEHENEKFTSSDCFDQMETIVCCAL